MSYMYSQSEVNVHLHHKLLNLIIIVLMLQPRENEVTMRKVWRAGQCMCYRSLCGHYIRMRRL